MKPGTLVLLFLFLLLFSFTSSVFPQGFSPYDAGITGVKTRSGLHYASYKVTNGQLKVYLPSDMAVGEQVTGSVEFEFYQLGTGELVSKNFNITDYTLVIENMVLDLTGENFKFDVPLNLPAGVLNVALEKSDGSVVSRAFFPVRLTRVAQYGKKIGDPSDFRIPATGRAGTPVTVSGPFDGDYETTKISISGKKVRILAESPRKLVFESPSGITGPRVIGLREGDVDIKNTFTNLDVVKVSEDQSFFVSRLQEDTKLVEKAKRGEFIIENEDVEETISKWRRLDPGRSPAKDVPEKLQDNESPVKTEGLKVSPEKVDESPDIDTPLKTEITKDEPAGSERSSVVEDAAAEEKTDSKETEESTLQNQFRGNIEIVREHLDKQYSARLSMSGIDLDKEVNDGSTSFAPASPSGSVGDGPEKKQDKGSSRVTTDVNGNSVHSGFSLQLASVKRQQDADKIIEKLKLKGYNAYSARVNVSGKGYWYRVKIGGFETRAEALDFRSSIDLKGIHIQKNAIFVTEEN